MTTLDDQLGRVVQKLRIVQQRPIAHKSMGEREHAFHLGSRLQPEAVSAFERTHGIELPIDYVAFLMQIGNGGAGPFYGILPLDRWAAAHLEYFDGESELPEDLLSRESPLRDGLTGIDWVEMLGGSPRPARFDPRRWHPYQGAITIAHLGATYYALLIVNGVTKGRVCSVDLDMQAPKFAPQRTFFDWYEAWLDDALSGKDIGEFGVAR